VTNSVCACVHEHETRWVIARFVNTRVLFNVHCRMLSLSRRHRAQLSDSREGQREARPWARKRERVVEQRRASRAGTAGPLRLNSIAASAYRSALEESKGERREEHANR
jgi:Spy/CpxP family protein refolding chaperone